VRTTCSSCRRLKISSQSRHSRRRLPTQRSACAFARGARHRRPDHLDSLGAQDVVEGARELRVAVTHEEPERLLVLRELHQQVARLLGHPALVRIRRDAAEVDAASCEHDEEQDVQPPQPDGIDGQEITGDDRGGLRA
jgi:hypothetical protein